MLSKIRFISIIITLSFFLSLLAGAKTLFDDDFNAGMDKWAIVGPGDAKIISDNSAPARYGPKVLLLKETGAGSDLMAFVKGLIVADGFYEILWKDAGLPEDADGVGWFRGQDEKGGPDTGGNGYLVELDTDTGLHIGVIKNGSEGPTFTSPKAEMSTGDWTWMKIRFEGPDLKVKIWPAVSDEPKEWNLEAEDKSFFSGSVGLRCWSGTAHIAYVRVSDMGGPSLEAVSLKKILATSWGELKQSY